METTQRYSIGRHATRILPKGLNSMFKLFVRKMSQLGSMSSKLVYLRSITGQGPQPLDDFWDILEKIAILTLFASHFTHFQSHWKQLHCWDLEAS